MVKYEENDYKFNMFRTYPFLSIGLFAFIAGVIFRLIRWKIISKICFLIVPLTLVTKIFVFIFFGIIEHPLSKLCAVALFARIALSVVSRIFDMMGIVLAVGMIGIVGAVCGIVAALGFLIRIFVALFMR